jgi:hypothetical protein
MQATAITLPKSCSSPAEKATSGASLRPGASAWQSIAAARASTHTRRRRLASAPGPEAGPASPDASATRLTSRAPMRATAADTEETVAPREYTAEFAQRSTSAEST